MGISVESFPVALALGFLLGGVALSLWQWFKGRRLWTESRNRAGLIVEEAKKQADQLTREASLSAREIISQGRAASEKEKRESQAEIQKLERSVAGQEAEFARKHRDLETRIQEFARKEKGFETERERIELMGKEVPRKVDEARRALERISELSRDEAKKQLVESMAEEARREAAKLVKQIEDEARLQADKKAKRIISIAIERLSGDVVQESTVRTVHLPSEELKGRIIGREGRNIRTIEAMTGCDLIMDETPDTVVISAHNPIRREIARRTLEKLVQDGRIHPSRIEEIVEKMTGEVEKSVHDAGEAALLELDLHGVHGELVKLLGALQYRYSYAQNVLQHSIEVGFLCGIMGVELGLNQKMARRAGLLHDIGKAVSQEVEGPHAIIGADFAKKYGEDARIVHAIAAHHEDVPQDTVLANIVDAADALSGARPGARREVLEGYIKRLEDLERIAGGFQGVEKSYALQAGRELRIFVFNDQVDDAQATLLSKDIARTIEKEMTYPGQIKVTVIRETRAVDYAR